jgi:hypothetical protein
MHSTMIVGAGPGGTGPLIWAAQHGKLNDWLEQGVLVLDRSEQMGGTIGRYIINSDSLGGVYLECLQTLPGKATFAPLLHDTVTRELEDMRLAFPPLKLVGEHMRNLGMVLRNQIAQSPYSEFRPGVHVGLLRLNEDGSIDAETVDTYGGRETVTARTAILAIGGLQDRSAAMKTELLPGVRLKREQLDKIVLSDELFRWEGLLRATSLLQKAERPRAVIIGGSHSAFSSGWVLTRMLPKTTFGSGDIVMLSRHAPRVFYGSRDEAQADGVVVTDGDICPVTNRVHRLGGLRGDGRELWRNLSGRSAREIDTRIRMISLQDSHFTEVALQSMLEEATLIIAAFGYRAKTLPVYDWMGDRLLLNAELNGPGVGPDARILLADNTPVWHLFGIGLGSGFRPWGYMGGEPNFEGQANSLWLYQNHIGEIIYRGVQSCLEDDSAKVSVELLA